MQHMTLVQTLLSFEKDIFFNRSMTFAYKYDINVLVLDHQVVHIKCGKLNSHSSRTNLRKEFNSSLTLCHFE